MENQSRINENKTKIKLNGTIKYLDFEGGFFGIIDEKGNKFKPINLPKEFQKKGLKVHIEAKERAGMVSIHMWGRTIEIIKIKKR